MRNTFKKITKTVLTLAIACGSISEASAANEITVCAVPQTYAAVENLKDIAPVKFKTFYSTTNEIYARVANNSGICDLVISSDEKLPVLLIRSDKAQIHSLKAFVRAPLLLWSKDPTLLDKTAKAVTQQRLHSLAIPKANLTPVGLATADVVSKKSFPTDYIKNKIYRAEQEYQVYSMVNEGNVQAGFLTKPVLVSANGKVDGSYWQVPRSNYPDILYYEIMATNSVNQADLEKLYEFVKSDRKSLDLFYKSGFSPITED